MVTLANINIWGRRAATVLWSESTQSAVLEYDTSFERSGLELSPIHMPLQAQHAYSFTSLSRDTFMGLPGLLADALPDAYGKALLPLGALLPILWNASAIRANEAWEPWSLNRPRMFF